MLFIVQHQTSELWMKLMLHEMRAVRTHLQADDLPPAFKMLARVARIMDQLVHAWDVLATMTPPEYTAIRPYLGASSGFQSYQYREIEFILGTRTRPCSTSTPPRRNSRAGTGAAHAVVYDEAIKLLARNGLPISAERLNADWTQPTAPTTRSASLAGSLPRPDPLLGPVRAGRKAGGLETAFRFWRFRHVTTVERIIGFKTGTGGTAGVSYLRKMLDVVLFPELFALRTEL
jgi:tryptophan 2,3-dioxygenase